MIFGKYDHVCAKMDIQLTSPSNLLNIEKVIPAGTIGVVLSLVSSSDIKVRWDFQGYTTAVVDKHALMFAEDYWKQRAMRAEAILGNLASLAEMRVDGVWEIRKSAERRIEQIVFQLAKERRGE